MLDSRIMWQPADCLRTSGKEVRTRPTVTRRCAFLHNLRKELHSGITCEKVRIIFGLALRFLPQLATFLT